VFSRRSATRYSHLQDYIRRLSFKDTELHWPAIDVQSITAHEHRDSRGLQLADAVAASFFYALDSSAGPLRDEYARQLRPVVYQHRGRFLRYGLKFMPNLDDAIRAEQRFGWVRDCYR
jgi:hypothetical protein